MTAPSVSIAIVNWNGWCYLRECLASVRALDYPAEAVETIVVDNGSTDGSVERVRSEFPSVHLVVNEVNKGFSAANNQAAVYAKNEYLAFLNNDAVVAPDWLRNMVQAAGTGERSVAAVASRILSSDGTRVQFQGGGMNFHGIGFQRALGAPAHSETEALPYPTLFACGAAMLVDRAVFNQTGGFD